MIEGQPLCICAPCPKQLLCRKLTKYLQSILFELERKNGLASQYGTGLKGSEACPVWEGTEQECLVSSSFPHHFTKHTRSRAGPGTFCT